MKIVDKVLITILVLFLISSMSHAHSVRLGNYNSASVSQSSIEGTANFPEKPDENEMLYDIDLSGAQSKSKTTETISSESNFGAGLTTAKQWSFHAGLFASRNTSENLTTAEPSLSISKKIFYKDNTTKNDSPKEKSKSTNSTDADHENFSPYLTIGFKTARSYTTQTTATLRSARVFGLTQTSNRLSLTWQPHTSWSFGASNTKYNYDRDVRALYNTLGTYPYLSEISSALRTLSDTVNTLPESSTTLSVTYFLNDSFDFTFDTQRTRDFVSDQFGTTNTVSINFYFLDSWNARLAVGSSTRSDTSEKSTSSEISIGYFF